MVAVLVVGSVKVVVVGILVESLEVIVVSLVVGPVGDSLIGHSSQSGQRVTSSP